jgi:hypothetical protein
LELDALMLTINTATPADASIEMDGHARRISLVL